MDCLFHLLFSSQIYFGEVFIFTVSISTNLTCFSNFYSLISSSPLILKLLLTSQHHLTLLTILSSNSLSDYRGTTHTSHGYLLQLPGLLPLLYPLSSVLLCPVKSFTSSVLYPCCHFRNSVHLHHYSKLLHQSNQVSWLLFFTVFFQKPKSNHVTFLLSI